MGKSSTKAKNKYNSTAYDRINLVMPKGKKEIIKSHADDLGLSVNGFINLAIDSQLKTKEQE